MVTGVRETIFRVRERLGGVPRKVFRGRKMNPGVRGMIFRGQLKLFRMRDNPAGVWGMFLPGREMAFQVAVDNWGRTKKLNLPLPAAGGCGSIEIVRKKHVTTFTKHFA